MITQTRQQDGISILEPNGKIVGPAASELREVIIPQIESDDTPRILLNFENVKWIDSSGIGVLVEAHVSSIQKNGRIGIVHLGKHIRNLIIINRLVHLFEYFDSEDAAVSALSAA